MVFSLTGICLTKQFTISMSTQKWYTRHTQWCFTRLIQDSTKTPPLKGLLPQAWIKHGNPLSLFSRIWWCVVLTKTVCKWKATSITRWGYRIAGACSLQVHSSRLGDTRLDCGLCVCHFCFCGPVSGSGLTRKATCFSKLYKYVAHFKLNQNI